MKIIKTKSEIQLNEKIIIIDSEEKTARSIIASLKNKDFKGKIGVFAKENKFNRRAIETLDIDYLFFQPFERKDTLKQRDSGLNHIIAKEAAKNKITIVIEISRLRKLKSKEKALSISRQIQNIKICRKAKCQIKIHDFDGKVNNHGLKSLATSLGMSSQQVKDSIIQNS